MYIIGRQRVSSVVVNELTKQWADEKTEQNCQTVGIQMYTVLVIENLKVCHIKTAKLPV